ncbi:hypothetical protein GCM10027294_27080 [Marinactinospora endophytica]
MTPGEFDACARRLPRELAERAESLRNYVVYEPGGARRKPVAECVALAFDAAYVGDLDAAASMLAEAEQRNAGISARRTTGILNGHHARIRRWSGSSPLVAATDASVKDRYAGMGYVTSDGLWGMRAWGGSFHDPSGPSRVLVQELRAVLLLLEAVDPETPFTLLVDSSSARHHLRMWQQGHTRRLPGGYDATRRRSRGRPSLVRLAEEMARRPHITVTAVKGHSGDLLNETADSLASMARRRLADPGACTTPLLLERAERFVDSFLGQWHRTAAYTGTSPQALGQRATQKQ